MADNILTTLAQSQQNANAVLDKVKAKGYAVAADLGTLASKDEVAKSDLASALSDEISAATSGVSANASAISTLNGTGAGSVAKAIDDAFDDFSTKVSDDGVVNTYKELIDYAASHSAEFTELVGEVTANKNAIGTKGAGETASTGLYKEIEDAVSGAETDINTALEGKVDKVTGKGLSANDFTDEYKGKLDDIEIATAAQVTAMIEGLNSL